MTVIRTEHLSFSNPYKRRVVKKISCAHFFEMVHILKVQGSRIA